MNMLEQYIIALTNLYGVVDKYKVVEIYNLQNEERIRLKKVEELLSEPSKALEKGFVDVDGDYFVNEAIMEYDEIELMLHEKSDKPYYVPAQAELLRYVENGYFEETEQYRSLLGFIRKENLARDDEKAEWLAEEVQGLVHVGARTSQVFEILDNQGIIFDGDYQAAKMVELISDLSNNTRIWENNGYTPMELFEFYSDRKKNPAKKIKKIGRNDPCPCGSGKKYKKCCLGK